ncbi:MAG: ABC transporter permease subunit [Chloroflexi bacterium]|nr:ABC transporter permease subunit [Chloroflexota bacterium]
MVDARALSQTRRGASASALGTAGRLWRYKWIQRGVVWGIIVVAWQTFGLIRGPFYFPTFTDTILGFVRLVVEGDLIVMAASLQQLLVGFALAVVIGIPVGLILGGSRSGEAVLGHYINAWYVTSKEALLPLMIILLGVGFEYRVGIVFAFSALYVIVNVATGMRDVSPSLIETARSFGASRRQVIVKIALPSVVPFMFAGIRLGYGFAIKGMVIAELWVLGGTGGLLADLALQRELDRYFAIALIIALVGVAGSSIIRTLERHITPWGAGAMRTTERRAV